MQPTLLILAAGMGSRYGGLKQLDAMGPSGQTMLDYAVEDALRADFGKVVFVIRKDFEVDFRKQIGPRYQNQIPIDYAFQAVSDLPEGFCLPPERTKPWGTAHAIRAARHLVREPFAVINADDFYGREAYQKMARHLNALETPQALHLAMIGYQLANTLSPHGTVNRGICRLHEAQLQSVEEHTQIGADSDGTLYGHTPEGTRIPLSPDTIVSMNFWGFTPALFDILEAGFTEFLKTHLHKEKSEYYIPSVVDALIQSETAPCPVLQTQSPWFGVTYPEDKPAVVASIARLTEVGLYPA